MKLGTKLTVAFVLGLLIIGAVGIQSYREIQRLTETNQWVVHTHEVLEKLEHVQLMLTDAETGTRGYVITGEDSYLEPYNKATAEMEQDIASVVALTQDNPEQQRSLQQLEKLSREKLDVLQEAVQRRKEAGPEATLPVNRAGRGQQIMEEIRALVAQMEQREAGLLDARNRAAGEVTRQSMQMLGFGVLLSLAILGIAAVIAIRTMQLADRGMRLGGAGRKWPGTALRYAFAAAAVVLAVWLKWLLERNIGPMPIFVTLYPAVLLVATVAGGGPGILATVLSAVAADYWFIEPIGQFSIANGYDAVALGIFTSTGIFLSLLAERLRRARQAEAVSAAQEQQLALLNMGNLMALDPDHRIVRWSEGNHRLYGFDTEEVRGKITYELFQPHFDRPLEQIRSELFEKDRWEGEVTRRGKDGTQIPVALLWVLRRDERGKPLDILEVSTDITRQKTAEESLRQQSEELAQQNEELAQQNEELARQTEELAQQSEELTQQNEELATQSGEIQALNTELSHREKMLQTLLDSARLPTGDEDVLEKICLAALEMIGLGADGAVICERRGDELHILAHAGFDGADVPRSWPVKGSFVEMMIEQNRTASLEDVALRPDLKLLPVAGRPPFGAILSSPLQLKGKPVGAVTVYSDTKQEWTAEQFRLIEWLAAQSSHALDALRLQAEVREGQRQNEFLADIIQRSSQPFVVGYPDGRLGLANSAFAQLTGYSREELQSVDWARTLTPPEWAEIERQKLEELTRTGRPAHYEKEYIRKDGTRVPIELLVHLAKDADGKPQYYYSFLTDITERKQAEEALRDSERRERERAEELAVLLESVPMPVFIARDPDCLHLTGNRLADEMLRVPSGDELSLSAAAETRPSHFRTLKDGRELRLDELPAQRAARGERVRDFEFALAFDDGMIRHVLGYGTPLLDAQGRPRGCVAALVDITERKGAEEALRESEARFRTLFDTMSEGFSLDEIICDDKGKPCDLRYLAVNPAFERHTGVKAADIVGRTCLELFPQAEPEWFDRYGKVALTGEPAHFESAFGPLGRWFEISAYQTDPGRFAVVFFDITDRKRAEEELRQRAQLLQNVIDGSMSPIFLKDLEGKFITINTALEGMLGISREKLKGKTDYDIAPRELADYWRTHDRQVVAAGKAIQIEEVADLPDGHHIFLANKFPLVDADGHTYGVGSISHDITERKRAEEALRESESKYRNLFMNMTEEVHFWKLVRDEKGQIKTWRVVDVNPPALKTWGRKSLEDTVGRSADEIYPGATAHYIPVVQKIMAEGIPYSYEDYFPVPVDKWFRFTSVPFGEEYFITTGADITDIKRAERDLRELNAGLEQRVTERTAEVQQQADQLRALAVELSQAEQRERKRLAAILHDHIQQLLVAAQLQLSLIERADPKTVRSTAQGISSIIAEAIAASRSLTVELSPPILHQSGLTAALTWLAAREDEKHLFKVHVRANSDAEPADPDVRALLFSSVQELLLNAVKHSGVREAQLIMRRSKENWTQIIVEDKGKGFDPSAISAHRGGGFGLFSIQQRLAYLGGRMEVDSAPGRGARFVLTIPIGQAAAKEAVSAAPSAPPSEMTHLRPKGRKISVLLVDDHRIMRQGLSSLLQFEEDIEVVGEAADGRQAIELARQHAPDVIIMDVNMPVMNGIEATRILSKELPQVKVIALSMHAERDTAEAMRQAGAVAYLTKGGPSEDLIAAIRACSQSRTAEP